MNLKFWQELLLIAVLSAFLALCTGPIGAASNPYEARAVELEATYNLQPGSLRALITVESNWNPVARGAHGEIGLGQVKPNTVLKMCPRCATKIGYLVYGSKGKATQALQMRLGVNPDGVFGPVTQAAVLAYQIERGLVADGIVGPQTWQSVFGEAMAVYDLEAELLDPYKNMEYAAMYLVWLRNKLGTDDPMILAAAYNSGDAGASVRYMLKIKAATARYAAT